MEGIRKPTLRSPLTFKLEKHDIEKPKGQSLTVPDESMKIETILRKFTTGLDSSLYREGQYHDGDHDSPDLEKLKDSDLFEKEQFRRGLADKILADEKVIKANEAKEKARLDAEAAELQEIRNELRKKKAENKNTGEGSEKGEPKK